MADTTSCDVLVVGAGPAGAACAREAVRLGMSVVLIDQRTLPRRKACGGLLSPRCMAEVGASFGDLPPFVRCSVPAVRIKLSKTGHTYVAPSSDQWQSVRREDFDHWLCRSCGLASVRKLRYVTHVEEPGRVRVTLDDGGVARELTAGYLVGADGGNSRVRRTIDRRFNPRDRLAYVQHFYEGEPGFDPASYHFLLARQCTDLYACFCVKDGLVSIGTTFLMSNRGRGYQAQLEKYLSDTFGTRLGRRVRSEGCTFGLSLTRSLYNFGAGRVLLAGEAAGLLSGLGEGIPSALISGRLAAAAIREAMQSGGDALERYRELVEPERQHLRRQLAL